MSFFAFQRVAEGYANHRPYYHPLVMNKIRQQLNLKDKFSRALDVGCGTGLSTIALKELAGDVIGTDGSKEMIAVANAYRDEQITYQHAPAEELPFDEQSFDLITVCGAINWIDRTRFFPEAKRILKEQGWLIIYDNFITEYMRENTAYTQWYQEQYLSRYPKPPRDEAPLTQSECERYGFHFNQEEYTNELALSRDEYIEFMLTQSNVIVAVDMGNESLSEVREWMHTTLSSIIPEPKGTFLFGGYIWYLQQV
ncbi:class I SAM-dependent methyltransferase [Chloroflexota bacterium]